MFEQLEEVFREMNLAQTIEGVVKAALTGLESLFVDARARLVPSGYDLTFRLRSSKLHARYLIVGKTDEHLLGLVREQGRAMMSSSGIDPEKTHCCVAPFQSGLLYLDSGEPFPEEAIHVASLVAHQLEASIARMGTARGLAKRDPLKELPDEAWIQNKLYRYDRFAYVMLGIDGFRALKYKKTWKERDALLSELAAYLQQRLHSDDLLARGPEGEFFVLTRMTAKRELESRWRGILTDFCDVWVALESKLSLSAGIAVFPDDGSRQCVRELSFQAFSRARFVGGRVVMVAEPSLTRVTMEGEPVSNFDPQSTAIVGKAVQVCQARKRAVDLLSLVWALVDTERKWSELLTDAGLNLRTLSEKLSDEDEERVEFSDAVLSVFAFSIEFAHRNNRDKVCTQDLFIATVSGMEAQEALANCGLNFGRMLCSLYRNGIFASTETFLVGDLAQPYRESVPRLADRPKQQPKLIDRSFGKNFAADVWDCLARAKNEARAAGHDLGFPHLYIAWLEKKEEHQKAARRALAKLRLQLVLPEESKTDDDVIRFFQELDSKLKEVDYWEFIERLLQRPEVQDFVDLIEGE